MAEIFKQIIDQAIKVELSTYEFLQIYNLGLMFNVINEKHMKELSTRIMKEKYFFMPRSLKQDSINFLIKMMKDKDHDISTLAAMSIVGASVIIEDRWVVQKLLTLLNKKNDPLRSYYIRSLGKCMLNWNDTSQKILEEMKKTKDDLLIGSWRDVIASARFYKQISVDWLNFIYNILNSNDINRDIKSEAYDILATLEKYIPNNQFDEKSLNLPLPHTDTSLFQRLA